MTNSKPAVLIVPGAWHPTTSYGSIVSALEKAGYNASTASLPSLNSQDPENDSCANDSDAVRQRVLSLINDDQKDVVIICHSYGGMPAGGAAYELSKASCTERGNQGSVVGLVYVSAFVVPEGVSLVEYLGGQHAPYYVPDEPSKGLAGVNGAKDVFYNDLSDEQAAHAMELIQPHSMRAFATGTPRSAWAEENFKGKLAFIRCTKDQALPPFLQDMFVEKSGVEWIRRDIESSHSPFLSQTEKLVDLLDEIISLFVQ